MGDFVLPIDTSLPILMVAGGIGITPYLSILSHLSQGVNKNDYDLNLLYAVNGLAEALDLTDYQSLLSSFEIIDTSNKNNRLSPELLMSKYELLNQPIIYLSGPEPMVESIGKQLLILGVPEFKLVRDFFPGYTNY
jgi:ferredoxin-NADP reductase